MLSRGDSDTNVEICALRRVQGHPNVIALLGPVEYSADSAFAVLEHCDTDLLEVAMGAESGLHIDVAQRYFAQLVKAVRHCHHKGVFHGDLKVSFWSHICQMCRLYLYPPLSNLSSLKTCLSRAVL